MTSISGKLFLISAPSGAGKTTLLHHVLARLHPTYPIERVITYTTKHPRPGERQGIEYHFLEEADFLQKIEEDFFVEHSTAYGSYYGFPRAVFDHLALGKSFMAIVDLAGATAIKTHYPQTICIGVRPPTSQVLSQRLTHRGEDSAADIAFRLTLAEQELVRLEESWWDYVIINDELLQAVEQLRDIVRRELAPRT